MKNDNLLTETLMNGVRGEEKAPEAPKAPKAQGCGAITPDNGPTMDRERAENGPTMVRVLSRIVPITARQWLGNTPTTTRVWRYVAMLLMVLTLGMGEMWGVELGNGQYIYINYSTSTWGTASAKFKFNWYWNVGDYCCVDQEKGRVTGENYAYAQTQNAYTRAVQILRFNSTYSSQWNYTGTVAVSDATKNCITLTAAISDNYTFSWTTYAPPMSTVTLSDNGTSIVSGSGTSGSPYLVYVGAKIKVSGSGTKAVADPDATIYYNFKQGSTSKQNTTTSTYQFDASSTPNTTYTINLTGYTKVSSTSSTTKDATALYYKTIELPASSHDITYTTESAGWTYGTQPSSAEEGDAVTFVVTPTAGYTVSVTSSDVTLSGPNASNQYTFTMPDNDVAISVSATERKRNVTISVTPAGTGTLNKTSASVGVSTTTTVTATANTGYAFSSWTATNCSVASTTSSSTTLSGDGSTGSGTLVATFVPKWTIKGSGTEMGAWETFNNLSYVSGTTYRGTISLAANTTYEFKVVDRGANTWYGNSSAFVGQSSSLTMSSSNDANCKIATASAGTYTFEFDSDSKALTVSYPDEHPSANFAYVKDNSWTGPAKAYTYSDEVASWTNQPAAGSFVFDGATYYYSALGGNDHVIISDNGDGTKRKDISSDFGKYWDFSSSSFKDFTVTITLDNKSATAPGTTSVSPVYKTEVLTNITIPEKTGYTFGGYYTAANGAGSQLINSSGVWQTVATYTDASKHWIKNTSVTLHAYWTKKKFTVTVSNDGHGTTSPSGAQSNIAQVDGIAISASANDDYEFVNWSVESGNGSFADATDASTTFYPTSTSTIQANFRSTITNSLTVVAGAGISSVTGSTDPITLGNSYAITATPLAGYTFSTWTADVPANASFASATSASTNVTVSNGSVTVTASATETKRTLTPTVSYDHGSSNYTATSANTIGIVTTSVLTASTPNAAHYTFAGWTLTNLTVTSGDKDNDLSITVKVTNPANSCSAVANYEEVLTSSWYVNSDANSPFTGWGTAGNRMQKKSGHSTEEIYYCTLNITSTQDYGLKIYNDADTGNKYYQDKNNGGSSKSIDVASCNGVAFALDNANDKPNMTFKAYLAGEYEFKLDNTGASPTLTVTWPEINQLRIFSASPTDATNTGNFDLSGPSSNNWSATRSLNANTTYTFKIVYQSDWYGKNSTTVTRASSSVSSLSTSGGNITIQTDVAGDYTFTFNSSTKNLSVTYPTAYTVTYGVGTNNGSNSAISVSPSFTSGAYVLPETDITFSKGTTKTGYTWKGWYPATNGSGDAWSTTDANLTLTATRTGNINVYACYNLVNYSITYNLNGGSNPGGAPTSFTIQSSAVTLPTPTKTGYTFNGWYANSDLSTGGVQTTIAAGSTGNKEYWAKWTAKNYTITLHEQGATTHGTPGDGGTITVTYDATTNLGSITALPERTGYTFDGYYDNAACTGTWIIKDDKYFNWDGTYINGTTGKWQYDDNLDLYAKWVANQYTVTLDVDEANKGTTTGATTSQDIYYDDATVTVPNRPTAANGYALDGYYTDHDGEGLKVINGDGTWIASVTGYTDANKKWIHADDVTLYAYYKKAEITTLAATPAVIAPSETITITPTIAPTPAGTVVVCYELQYNNETPLPSQPSWDYDGNAVSFAVPAASATYRIQAKLCLNNCSGTVLHTTSTTFQVAGEHTVTIQYKCGEMAIKESSEMTARPLAWSDEIEAPDDIFGYTFARWEAGDGVTITDDGSTEKTTTTEPGIQVKANYDGTLTAVYTQKSLIYFKNTLGWSDVYVNFYTGSYWNNPKGSGNKNVTNRNKAMTRIGETDVWYYDYGAAGISPTLYVSFTNVLQDNYDNFWNNPTVNVVYPANYQDDIHADKSSENGFKAATPMFVPVAEQSATDLNSSGDGKASYFNRGYWTQYIPGTGYTLEIYNAEGNSLLKSIAFTSLDDLMPMKAVADLEGGATYKFQLRRGGTESAGIYYGNTGTMTYDNHGEGTAWSMTNTMAPFSMCGITTNASGDYTFHLSYSADGSNRYRLRIAVDYPVASGDYRILYKDAAKWSQTSAHSAAWNHPSSVITKNGSATETKADTVSLYVAYGSSPSAKFQQATVNPSTGVVEWADVASGAISLSGITSVGVYNFIVSQAANGSAISLTKTEEYEGNYYIRTDCAGGGKWDNFRGDINHLMTYSDYAAAQSATASNTGFTHYFTHWVTSGTNVKYTIANDYSQCISDTLSTDLGTVVADISAGGDLNSASANIRFMWNQVTNKLSRAYIGGSTFIADRFLVLEGDSKMFDENGNALTNATSNRDHRTEIHDGVPGTYYIDQDNQVILNDDENFVYERIIQVQPTARGKLTAKYNNNVQYFIGSLTETVELLGGESESKYTMRIIYDFKTNRLVTAYIPSGTITEPLAIHADIMLVREHQEAGQQLTFSGEGAALSDVKTVYGVMRFNRWTLNNKSTAEGHSPVGDPKSAYERSLYWISFPFDVNLSDVFGFGTYGTDWIIMEYDGAERAAEGYWADSEGFWKYIFDRRGVVLEAGKGYVLALDLDRMKDNNTSFWTNNIEQVELFFPSASEVENIEKTNTEITVDSHECTITARPGMSDDRTKKDSHWNIIGVPSYANYGSELKDGNNTTITWNENPSTQDLPFLYEWNMVDNTYSVQSGTTYPFKSMHAYMVQYYGTIKWLLASATPSSAPARVTNAPQNIEFRLELQENDKMTDHTFIRMTNDEAISANFDFNYDLSKQMNSGKANIYTMVEGYIQTAGNCLPMSEQTTVVPVGVKTAANGDYTFSMPEGTEGIGVVLIDTETGIRTSLSALDYTVSLDKGTYDERFILEISPIYSTPTDVETVSDEQSAVSGVRKMLIDGLLYIVREGKMYDARGARVE